MQYMQVSFLYKVNKEGKIKDESLRHNCMKWDKGYSQNYRTDRQNIQAKDKMITSSQKKESP